MIMIVVDENNLMQYYFVVQLPLWTTCNIVVELRATYIYIHEIPFLKLLERS